MQTRLGIILLLMRSRLALFLLVTGLFPVLACSLSGAVSTDPANSDHGPSAGDLFSTAIANPPVELPHPTSLPGEQPPSSFPPMIEATPAPTQEGSLHSGEGHYIYRVQAGDTLLAVARRFGVEPGQIASEQEMPYQALLYPGQSLLIPGTFDPGLSTGNLVPDGEIIYSPLAADFHVYEYVSQAGGYLSTYSEYVDGEMLSGAEIVQRVAIETSTNPRFLLAFLEHRSQWVSGQPPGPEKERYPIGFYVPGYQGLYKELSLTAKMLLSGYYGWRSGELNHLNFTNGEQMRIFPGVNAGTAAVQYLFSTFHRRDMWAALLYGPDNFIQFYQNMLGDPWGRDAAYGLLLPPGLVQPALELPFAPGERWSFTGGPHISWITGTPRGALDFAPVTGEPACAVSRAWVTASASGQVVRSERGVVAIDLDGDGLEQTGWVLVYMHIAARDRIPLGVYVDVDDPIGHPSCEGGRTTGTHMHIVRKYNGEWIAADGPLPFILSGWQARQGERPYEGTLIYGEYTVSAQPDGSSTSSIIR